MRSVSDAAKARLQIQLRLDVQVLRQRSGPQFALQIEHDNITGQPRANLQAIAQDTRLESVERVGQLPFQLAHIRRHQPKKMARAKIDDRFGCVRIIFDTEGLLALLWQMGAGAEKPLQIAHHTLAITLERNDSL